MIYVVGHFTPDTDATCVPIVVAWYLNDIKQTNAQAILHGQTNKEAQFVLDYFNVSMPEIFTKLPENSELFIVDTTNPQELPLITKSTNVKIIEIVDHHKMGGLTTMSPLSVTIKPLGSSASVFYQSVRNQMKGKLTKQMAGLLASCIISDTLNLHSPTTTDLDQKYLEELAKQAEIRDIDAYANQMFTAKSSIEGMDLEDIIKADFKTFSLAGQNTFVGVFETVKPDILQQKKKELVTAMKKIKSNENYDQMFFFVIDILQKNAYYFAQDSAEDKIVADGYKVAISSITELVGVVSRKKQIIPVLENLLKD